MLRKVLETGLDVDERNAVSEAWNRFPHSLNECDALSSFSMPSDTPCVVKAGTPPTLALYRGEGVRMSGSVFTSYIHTRAIQR